MNRKMQIVASAMIWLGLNCWLAVHAADRPNILLIAIDDLNDWVGCLGGHPQALTPNIDKLASESFLFRNAHCQGPICGPSRASLLSGKYPYSTGLYQQPNKRDMQKDEQHFRGHMLPEYFAAHGYKTLAAGKIFHGYPDNIAFQQYAGKWDGFGPKPPGGKRFNYFLPDVPWTGTQTDWGPFPDVDDKMPDFKSASWAENELAKQHDKPFLMAVGFLRPHVPFYVPEKWFVPFPVEGVELPRVRNDDLDDVPEISRQIHEVPKYPNLAFLQRDDNEQFRKCVQAYLACTHFVDHQVGRVLTALRKSRYSENTIVVLFSDHGYHLGEKDRVSKQGLWEESVRVPLIVQAPGMSSGHSNLPVGLIDIYPTLLELSGLPAKESNEGLSLRPILAGEDVRWRHSIPTTYAKGSHSLRSERFRYLRFPNGEEELYDHQQDPQEWANLAGQADMANVLQEFRQQLPKHEAAYHKSTQAGPINAWFKKHLAENGIGD